jgi:hypothetical protein
MTENAVPEPPLEASAPDSDPAPTPAPPASASASPTPAPVSVPVPVSDQSASPIDTPEPATEPVSPTAVEEVPAPAPEIVSESASAAQPIDHSEPEVNGADANIAHTTSSTRAALAKNSFRGSEGRARGLARRNEKREKKLQLIVEHTRAHSSIANDDIEKLLHLSNATASRYLKLLVERGSLIRSGKGRSVRYSIRS